MPHFEVLARGTRAWNRGRAASSRFFRHRQPVAHGDLLDHEHPVAIKDLAARLTSYSSGSSSI
jgi:hypothetical protein